ncbi:MAG: hypothetical protein ABJA67_06345 [Chthonomonadales bacterium]
MRLFKFKRKLSKAKLLTCFGCLGVPMIALILTIGTFYWRNRKVVLEVPTPAMPAVNARDDFFKAGTISKNMKHPSILSSPKPETMTLADMAANAKDVKAVIAALQPGFHKEYRENPIRSLAGIANMYPNFALFRESARQMTGAAIYHDLTGNHRKAMELRLDAMELGVMAANGGSLISDLVSDAIVAIAANNMEWSFSKLNTNDLARMAQRLEIIRDKAVPFSSVMKEEGDNSVSTFVALSNAPSSIRERYSSAMADSSGNVPVVPKLTDFREYLKSEFTDKNQMAHQVGTFYNQFVEEVKTPYHLKQRTSPGDNAWLLSINGVGLQAWSAHVKAQSEIDLISLEVALLRFKADNHRFPASLSEVSPKYLKTIPVDPFNNNGPYRYQLKQDGSYQLYGLGPDMIDHHGTSGKRPGEPGTDMVAGKLGRVPKFPTK